MQALLEVTRDERNRLQRKTRCRHCISCIRENCGECVNCVDMIQFGGKGLRKKTCVFRICEDNQSVDTARSIKRSLISECAEGTSLKFRNQRPSTVVARQPVSQFCEPLVATPPTACALKILPMRQIPEDARAAHAILQSVLFEQMSPAPDAPGLFHMPVVL